MFNALLLVAIVQMVAPESLKPEGGWTLDERPRCSLSRKFASAAGPVTLAIKPNIASPGGELIVILPGQGGRYTVDEGRIVLGDNEASFPAVWSLVGKHRQPLHGVTLQPADGFWTALPTARVLTLDVGRRKQVRLEVGPMVAATQALETCRRAQAAAMTASRR